VFLDDVIKFKYIVKTLDVGNLTQRKFCEEVEKVYNEIFGEKDGEVIYEENGDTKKEKIDQYGDVIKEENNNDR
jgi:hypothetical protein|tara:strand:+ start:2585 stop:2806 length:222 start_codon:yes stop_codon:yes gene_type:complete